MDKIDKMDYQTNSISSESSDDVDSSGSGDEEPLAESEMDKILKEHDLYSDKEEDTSDQKIKDAESLKQESQKSPIKLRSSKKQKSIQSS